jgi:cation transport protein ChaC
MIGQRRRRARCLWFGIEPCEAAECGVSKDGKCCDDRGQCPGGCGREAALIPELLATGSAFMDVEFDHHREDLWVFGYGSLIWRPGFEYVERVPAHTIGLHRSLCVYSFDHRGTPERPGLVLGLDFGGACRGIAYRVAATKRKATLDYLRAREQTTIVYREMVRMTWLPGPPERRVDALCYVVDRGHPQYAGRLTLDQKLHIVRQGHGRSGNNRDYVIETVKSLEALNIVDHDLHLLAERLKGTHEPAAVPSA